MPVHLTCQQCGSAFTAYPCNLVVPGLGRFCSIPCASLGRRRSPADRFWQYVERGSDCWEWQGRRTRSGYGQMRRGGRADGYVYAHRMAWEIATGEPAPDDMKVLHACDNRPCVRNDDPGIYVVNGIARPRFGHLWLGTSSDNMLDAFAKGRATAGHMNAARLARKVV